MEDAPGARTEGGWDRRRPESSNLMCSPSWPSNFTFDRPAGSHSLAAAGQRARYAPHDEDALRLLANVTVAFVALSHVGFLILEMFFWDHPVGREVFAMTPEQSKFSAALAAKQ